TPDYMTRFQTKILKQQAPPGIVWWVAAGTYLGPPGSFLNTAGQVLYKDSGPNDGFVAVSSATALQRSRYPFVRNVDHDSIRIGHNSFPYIQNILLDGTPAQADSTVALVSPLTGSVWRRD